MKNQYVGDVGDFGKYALLRAFAEAGVRVGVNWYLTADDGSTDGRFTGYLDDERMHHLCPEVFDALNRIVKRKSKSVRDVEKSGIIKDAIFFNEEIDSSGSPAERIQKRELWFARSIDALEGADLVFLDPDNGLLESGDASKLGAEKYVLPGEVEQCFNLGKNVVYYCHKGRRKLTAWFDYKSLMFDRIPSAKSAVLTYHKGTQRSYIFLIHDESFIRYRKIIDRFMQGWYRIFTEEYTNKGNPADDVIGKPFSFEKSDGSTVTIQQRADGRIQLRNSKTPCESMILTADHFASLLRI